MNPMYIETSDYGMPRDIRASYAFESDFDGGLPIYSEYGFNPLKKVTEQLKARTKVAAKKIAEDKARKEAEIQKAQGLGPLAASALILGVGVLAVYGIRKFL